MSAWQSFWTFNQKMTLNGSFHPLLSLGNALLKPLRYAANKDAEHFCDLTIAGITTAPITALKPAKNLLLRGLAAVVAIPMAPIGWLLKGAAYLGAKLFRQNVYGHIHAAVSSDAEHKPAVLANAIEGIDHTRRRSFSRALNREIGRLERKILSIAWLSRMAARFSLANTAQPGQEMRRSKKNTKAFFKEIRQMLKTGLSSLPSEQIKNAITIGEAAFNKLPKDVQTKAKEIFNSGHISYSKLFALIGANIENLQALQEGIKAISSQLEAGGSLLELLQNALSNMDEAPQVVRGFSQRLSENHMQEQDTTGLQNADILSSVRSFIPSFMSSGLRVEEAVAPAPTSRVAAPTLH